MTNRLCCRAIVVRPPGYLSITHYGLGMPAVVGTSTCVGHFDIFWIFDLVLLRKTTRLRNICYDHILRACFGIQIDKIVSNLYLLKYAKKKNDVKID